MGKDYTVAIDDGHGMGTGGKRTPIFPEGSGMKSETGNFMHENEFNRAVAKYAKEHLIRCGVKVVETAPGDSDVPLRTRARIAREAKADVFVSIHANANTSVWNSANGIETFHQEGCGPNSIKLARIMQKHLLKGTPLADRKVKSANFQVLRETHKYMASCLIEAGFMDNLKEAKLLLSDSYRRETGKEVAQAACEFLGVTFVEENLGAGVTTGTANEDKKEVKDEPVSFVVVKENGSLRPLSTKGFLRSGTSYAPIRAVSIVVGQSLGFNEKTGKASINEVILDNTVVIDNVSYAPSRDVAKAVGMIAQWNKELLQVKFVKGE